jgi:membrane-bound metal-dependent hydrolase YbcI (DUF457 family)
VLWIGALQLMLDLGHERDWFNSTSIIILALTAVVGFIVFMIWELTEKHPVVNLYVFRHRGFAVSVLALAFGFGSFFGRNNYGNILLELKGAKEINESAFQFFRKNKIKNKIKGYV